MSAAENFAEFVARLSREDRALLSAELREAELREALAPMVAAQAPAPQAEQRLTCSVEESAEVLGCSSERVRQLIHAGELQAFRAGHAFRIRTEELYRFMRAQEQDRNDRARWLASSKRGRPANNETAVDKTAASSRA